MKLKFLAKSLEIYSTTLSDNNSVSLKLNDVYDFPIDDAKRLLQDFSNDFCIANDLPNNDGSIPKAKIKYIIVNKRNNVLF